MCLCGTIKCVRKKRKNINNNKGIHAMCESIYIYIYNLYKQWERVLMVLDMFGGKMWKLENKIYK